MYTEDEKITDGEYIAGGETGNEEPDADKITEEEKKETEEKELSKKEYILKEVLEWVGTILTALVITLFINFCILINARVPSGSMENTIMTGDRLFGNRLAYVFSEPQRGDIVIFHFPDNERELYIKRLIGLPGETVEIKNGGVYINGILLEERYLSVTTAGEFGPYEVPEGHYFMMGDNRNNSADSRFWQNTYLEKSKIVGKAFVRYYPSFTLIKGANYDWGI